MLSLIRQIKSRLASYVASAQDYYVLPGRRILCKKVKRRYHLLIPNARYRRYCGLRAGSKDHDIRAERVDIFRRCLLKTHLHATLVYIGDQMINIAPNVKLEVRARRRICQASQLELFFPEGYIVSLFRSQSSRIQASRASADYKDFP